jgi:tetratricopeptide (TPR) repeat protein
MQKTLIGILTVFFLSSFCLNLYHVNASGQEFRNSYLSSLPVFYQSFDTTFYKELLVSIEKDKSERILYHDENKALSDKSVALIKLRKVKEAQKILLNLYEKAPNEYNFVINLATSYELTGDVDKALMLTKKGLEINKNSHRGSEWFHVKVLEAKQKMKNNPDWIKENKVLDVELKTLKADKTTVGIQEIISDIGYQLTERVPFSPQNDILLANIFNEYGDILSEFSVEMAYVAYGIGEKYDNTKVFGMASKKARILSLIEKYDLKVPNINDFYPSKDKFGKEKMRMGPTLHRSNDFISLELATILITVLVVFCLSIAFLVYRLYKKYFS